VAANWNRLKHLRTSAKRNSDDDYEWWTLREGQYLVEYNESLTGEATVTLQPPDRTAGAGRLPPDAASSTSCLAFPLSVGGAGIRIKENARVSTIVDAEE